ncbi:MAG TPA: hypothetical protein VFT22_05475 [Kofleriaceae bacterium]|nr:hypothetical protein [Kofleriaceae bacterium]
MNRSIPGNDAPTISALHGAIFTSTSTDLAAASITRTSSTGAAPAMHPASATAWFCSSAGVAARTAKTATQRMARVYLGG